MIGWTTLALLTCVLRGDALDLLRAAATPGSEYQRHLSSFTQEMELEVRNIQIC